MAQPARLRRSQDIAAVRAEGRSFRNGAFLARVRSSTGGTTRIAVSASRAIGGSVVRNRARRRVREAFRRAASTAPAADVVATVRPEAVATDFGTLLRDAASALRETRR